MSCRESREHAKTDEAGFSLIELLVAIVIVGIIMSVLTLAVSLGFEHTVSSGQRLDRSNIAEFTARRFTADAVSSVVDQSAIAPCPGVGTVVSLGQNDGSVVSYAVVTGAGRTTLFRRVCSGAVVSDQDLGSDRAIFVATGACPSGGAVVHPQRGVA